jgi:hypothetical protein
VSTRFVLRYSGPPAAAAESGRLSAQLSAAAGVTVLDESPRMLLVESSRLALDHALKDIEGWEIVPESSTPLPDPRPRVRRG